MKVVIFFFKQKTAYEIKECDWSSDVCSSDLPGVWGNFAAGSGAEISENKTGFYD